MAEALFLNWQLTPISLLYFIATGVAFGLAFYVWKLKPDRVQKVMVIALSLSGIWALGTGLELAVSDLSWKLFVVRFILYPGVIGTIFFWALFTIKYSHYEHWLNRYTIALLSVVPILVYLSIVTLPYHQLYYQEYWVAEANGLLILDKTYGPIFWMWAAFSYVVLLGGAILLIQSVIRFPRLYQAQTVMLIVGVMIPLIPNVVYLAGIRPFGPFDTSPLFIIISFMFIVFSMVRFRFLDVMPVAYDLVFRNVPSSVLILDMQGRIVEMNPAAERVLHRPKHSVMGQMLLAAFPEHTELINEFQDVTSIITEVILGAEKRIYELQIVPLNNHRGQLVGQIILLHDITTQKQAIAERDQLIDELDAYAHTVAHDLKNPLAAIIGRVELLKQFTHIAVSDPVQDVLDVVARNSYKMTSIIDALLILARVRSMKEVVTKPLAMESIVQDTVDRLDKMISEAHAELIVPPSWPVAQGYAPWVEEIWANYISNGVKYGGTSPTITLGADEVNEGNGKQFVRFWVQDNGPGMTAVEISQLFEKFTRLDQHQGIQGHGLGLSIVRRIVKRLGGTAGVESEVGQGSTFYFTLPRK